MKKLIAILVVFALVMGAAFAETAVGGNIKMGFDVLKGESEADDVFAGNLGAKDGAAALNVTFGDASSGGKFVINASGVQPYWNNNLGDGMFAFVWWRPIDAFRLQIGCNPDGDWGFDEIVGWGFTSEAKAVGVAETDYQGDTDYYMKAVSSAFGGGIGGKKGHSLNLNFYPMDALTIGLGFELGDEEVAQNAYLTKTHLNFNFNLEDIGRIKLAFVTGDGLAKDAEDTASPGEVSFAFFLSAIEGLGAELGLKTKIPGKDQKEALNIGLGLSYGADSFAIKFRAGAILEEKVTTISVGLLPNFALGDIRLFIHLGLGMNMDDTGAESVSTTDWFFNPYIEVPAGALKLYAGLKVTQKGMTDGAEPPVKFGAAFGFNAYF